jgi:nesprin-1
VTHNLLGFHGNIPLQELIDSREIGAGRLSRVEWLAPAVRQNTAASGYELMLTEMQALRADWKQWEDSVFQTQSNLENLVSEMALSEQEFSSQVVQCPSENLGPAANLPGRQEHR